MVIALGKENFKKINKKHPLPSAGAVALGKEVLKKQISLPSAGAVALGKEF